jgi:hypothetical protein
MSYGPAHSFGNIPLIKYTFPRDERLSTLTKPKIWPCSNRLR